MKTIKNTSKQTETNTQPQEIPATVKALNVKVRSICKNIIHSLIFFRPSRIPHLTPKPILRLTPSLKMVQLKIAAQVLRLNGQF